MGSIFDFINSLFSWVSSAYSFVKGFFSLITSYTDLSATVFSWMPSVVADAILFFLGLGVAIGMIRIANNIKDYVI